MEFDPFASFWDGQPNYLPFLNLTDVEKENKDWNLTLSLEKLNQILQTNSESSITEGITYLLATGGWRPHLVACVSLLLIKSSKRNDLLNIYWDRFSKGSWVNPQILVTLSIVDKDFEVKVQKMRVDSILSKKTIAAIDYLLHNTVNNTIDSESGGLIARDWKADILNLIERGKLRFDQY